MNSELNERLHKLKCFQGLGTADVLMSQRFLENLEAYINVQMEERNAARACIPEGCRLPAHAIDKIESAGLMTPTTFAKEYFLVVMKNSKLPADLRNYIEQLGRQAYNKTILDIIAEEDPKLAKELTNKNNLN